MTHGQAQDVVNLLRIIMIELAVLVGFATGRMLAGR